MLHSLIICTILAIGYLSPTQAVTDAELDTLEKQIEQQEVEEKQQAEAEAKLKANEKRKAKAEAEKKRLVELEKKQQEEEAKRLAKEKIQADEEEKKTQYDKLIRVAQVAIGEKDKELAINKFNEALLIYPDGETALTGLKEAKDLLDKWCYKMVGKWRCGNFITRTFYEDKTVFMKTLLKKWTVPWICESSNGEIKAHFSIENNLQIYTLSNDGNTLTRPMMGLDDKCKRIN